MRQHLGDALHAVVLLALDLDPVAFVAGIFHLLDRREVLSLGVVRHEHVELPLVHGRAALVLRLALAPAAMVAPSLLAALRGSCFRQARRFLDVPALLGCPVFLRLDLGLQRPRLLHEAAAPPDHTGKEAKEGRKGSERWRRQRMIERKEGSKERRWNCQ